jgi:hypothetical protein
MKTAAATAIAISLASCIPAKPAAVQQKPQPVESREPSLTLARNRAIRACAQTGEAVDAERRFIGIGPTSQLYRENVVAFYRSRVVIEWPGVTAAQLCEELPEVLKVAYVVNCSECAKTIRSAVDAAACEE